MNAAQSVKKRLFRAVGCAIGAFQPCVKNADKGAERIKRSGFKIRYKIRY